MILMGKRGNVYKIIKKNKKIKVSNLLISSPFLYKLPSTHFLIMIALPPPIISFYHHPK